MTGEEAKAYIAWFRGNHLPDGVNFVRTSNGRDIMLDSLSDEDAAFVAQQFENMLDTALKGRNKK